MMATYGQKIDKIEKTVTNELAHAIATRQMGGIGDWFQANSGVVLLIGGSVLLIWLLREHENSCPPCPPCEQGYTRSTSNGRKSNSIGSMLANRAAGKVVDYGLNEIFKKR